MNEASLVAAAKAGQNVALDALCQAHAPRLFRTVERITRNHQDAEDAVQDSFLNALRHLQSFDGRSSFSTWLTRIGINSALMILRKRRSLREISAGCLGLEDELWELTDSAPNPEELCADQEQRKILRTEFSKLSTKVRHVIELRTFEDLSNEETAARIGISGPAAKARFFHGKAALRESRALQQINNRNGASQACRSAETAGRQIRPGHSSHEGSPRVANFSLGEIGRLGRKLSNSDHR